jgi:hypothetical protein
MAYSYLQGGISTIGLPPSTALSGNSTTLPQQIAAELEQATAVSTMEQALL